ncbi:hypothetical protein [Bradyrhizobium sp. SZCCHNS3002]|uniref:hypothetical protein n=1 Tax=Bradyrhizobium sp. SZCCHNS3002 TaxID=3057310 RepID=UPI0028ECC261|nr:hypothetical protein [Bradyrhizobium sp. SZCCHNS3002]
MNFDASATWRLITRAFGTNYPMRLAIGISLACLVHTVVRVFAKALPESNIWQALNEFGTTWYILIIAPLLFVSIVFGKQGAPEGAIQQINTIKALISEGGFNSSQRVMIWRSIVDKYLTALRPDLWGKPDLGRIFDEVKNDFTPGEGHS